MIETMPMTIEFDVFEEDGDLQPGEEPMISATINLLPDHKASCSVADFHDEATGIDVSLSFDMDSHGKDFENYPQAIFITDVQAFVDTYLAFKSSLNQPAIANMLE